MSGAHPAFVAHDTTVGTVTVRGLLVDTETRCVHYHTDLDVVAIRFRCCDAFYACIHCHAALVDHDVVRWPVAEREAAAIVCGVCAGILSISTYVDVDACPTCAAGFNPGCRLHHPLYFE